MIGLCEFDGRSIDRVGLVPCLINQKNQPVPLPIGSADAARMLDYMRSITADAGLKTDYDRGGMIVGGFEAFVVRPPMS